MFASARRSTRWWRVAVVALAIAAAASCSGGSDPAATGSRDRLIFAAAADATTLDPHNTTDTESDQVIMMVYEPLIAFDEQMTDRRRGSPSGGALPTTA